MELCKKETLFKYQYYFLKYGKQHHSGKIYSFIIIPHVIQHTKKELHLISFCRARCHIHYRSI